MLPYQVMTTGVPYGYTLIPQPTLAPGQRLVPVPGGKNMYHLITDYVDIDQDYVPQPHRYHLRSRLLDDMDSGELEQFSIATRHIKKDANAILERFRPNPGAYRGRGEEPALTLQSLRPGRRSIGASLTPAFEEKRSSLKKERLGYDSNNPMQSNIAIRAQYAAMRQSAGRSYRVPCSRPSALSSRMRPSSP